MTNAFAGEEAMRGQDKWKNHTANIQHRMDAIAKYAEELDRKEIRYGS